VADHVLVTGGAGYVGSHACKALARAGFTPVTYDNLSYGHEWVVKWGPFEQGNILDGARLRDVFRQYAPVAVMHFAAFAYVGESVTEPLKYYRNNVLGSLSLFEAAIAAKVRRVVFSSTCATYGIPAGVPIREDTEQRPINPYGTTKLVVERMLADFAVAYGLTYAALRYFNAAGADRDGEIGEDHDPETHLIPLALAAIRNPDKPLRVFGTDYETPDGTAIRDYVHVDDLARVHVAALRYLLKGGAPVAANIGTGTGHSVRDVIETAERVTGRTLPFVAAPRRPGDPPALVAEPALLKPLFGVDPKEFASLDEIIATAWRWHSRRNTEP
jgi:UDP-arabinose 4-epimerase